MSPVSSSTLPHPTDVHVGKQLRLRRTMLGMSQDKLGGEVGLTFQQVQKYERGVNRISASRLLDFSRVLGVGIGYFFEGLEGQPLGFEEEVSPDFIPEGDGRELLELIRIFKSIPSPSVRRQILGLVRSIAASVDGSAPDWDAD